MFDVLSIPDLIERETCQQIVREMKGAGGKPALVYGSSQDGSIDPRVRQVTRVSVSDATADLVLKALTRITAQLSTHFDVNLAEVEPPQFLHYREGDFFVAHQDGNTPLVHDDTRFRKVSVVLFLNEQADANSEGYKGGTLVLHGSYPNYDDRHEVPCLSGKLAAFRSEVTHEVTPIEAGERFTIVSWYRAAATNMLNI